ncbi:MAG: hypothetical protein CMQ46_11235 [Gammaproteobacteria bacterium]|nr:hypothetical protein [Gammaproteobacteria bacterium]HBN14766.1 hypothetical protein [Pseudohongiella sp.]|tara:strand:- start:42 stop:242 length:201 start_codon:yes stop_codon:yes gene_type:complete
MRLWVKPTPFYQCLSDNLPIEPADNDAVEVFDGDWQDIGKLGRLAALNHQLSVEKKAENGSGNLSQ